MELEFRKPDKRSVAKRMAQVAAREGLQVNEQALEALVEAAGNDIRLVLGQLQMLRLRSASLTYDQAVKGGAANAKDFELSPFTAAQVGLGCWLMFPHGFRLLVLPGLDDFATRRF